MNKTYEAALSLRVNKRTNCFTSICVHCLPSVTSDTCFLFFFVYYLYLFSICKLSLLLLLIYS
nr:MAG TPA: hypothetical protein [Caudoviricetes sp.]